VPSLRKLLHCTVDCLIRGLSVHDEQAWIFFFVSKLSHQELHFLLNILRSTSFKIVFTSAECFFFCIMLNQFAHAIRSVVYTVTVWAQNDCVRCMMNSCFGPVEGTILELVWRDRLKQSWVCGRIFSILARIQTGYLFTTLHKHYTQNRPSWWPSYIHIAECQRRCWLFC
jgi:hypothetical protein